MPERTTPNLPANPNPTSPRWLMAIRRRLLRMAVLETVREFAEWLSEWL